MKKVSLNKESLRKLDEKDLDIIRGGRPLETRGGECLDHDEGDPDSFGDGLTKPW